MTEEQRSTCFKLANSQDRKFRETDDVQPGYHFTEGFQAALTLEVLIHCPEVKALIVALKRQISRDGFINPTAGDLRRESLKPFQNLGDVK